MGSERKRCAVFLDRDGTLIEDRGHLSGPDEVRFFSATLGALERLRDDFLFFLVTNQPGVRAVDLVLAGKGQYRCLANRPMFFGTTECPKWSRKTPDAAGADEGGESRTAGIPQFPQFTSSAANSANLARSRFTSRISFLRL
jgi:hypothetical protein